MIRTFAGQIAELAERTPQKDALIFRKEKVTYGQLLRDVKKIAWRLKAEGVKAGDVVLCAAPSRPLTIEVLLAVNYAGGTCALVDKNASAENISSVREDSGAVLLITNQKAEKVPAGVKFISMSDILDPEAPECGEPCPVTDPEAIAEIIFTTGTTGRPKGAMLSHRAVMSIIKHTSEGIGITAEDRVLMPLPLHHSYALRVVRAVLSCGGTVVFQNGFTFAKEIENNLDQNGCTGLAVVPVSMEILRAQMQEHFYEIMGRFRYIETGAGSLTVEQRKRLTANLPNTKLYNTWGSSETGGALFTPVNEVSLDPVKVAAIGKPLGDVEVRVLGPDGEPITSDRDHPGTLALRGEMIMSGYCGRPELSAEALKDGWLHTNDLVYQDAEGYVYMLGRADDIINVGGEKVSPIEVENTACEFPHVKECICVGVEDTKTGLGQVPLLGLSVEEGFDETELKIYLAKHLERCKLPAHYLYVDAIPRNRMQKPDRKAMKAYWAQQEKG